MAAVRVDICPICKGNHLIHKLSVRDNVSGESFDILACSDCGLHITQRVPAAGDMQAYYPDKEAPCYKIAKEKSEKWLEYLLQRWYKQQVDIVCDGANRLSGVLFELGSKQGFFGNTIRNKGWITHAVEHDNTAREYGNNRFLLQAEDSRCFFDIKPRSYNVVVAWDTLGEAADMHRTLDKLSQLITSDGVVIIAFHNAMCEDATYYGKSWSAWDVPRKRWHLTPHSFEKLVAAHGLIIADVVHAPRRAAITAITSSWQRDGIQKLFGTWAEVTKRKLSHKEDNTYYIYILKHPQQ